MEQSDVFYLNPAGIKPSVEITPLTPRPDTLNGKVVYCVSQHVRGADAFQRKVVELLPQYAPGVKAIYLDKPDSFGNDSAQLWDEIAAKGNAVIYAGSSLRCLLGVGCLASWRSASRNEESLQFMYVVDEPFFEDVKVTLEKEGMPSLRTVVVPHPCGLIPDEQFSQIVPLLVDALVQPLNIQEKQTGIARQKRMGRIAMAGTLDEVQEYFYRHRLSDGLPNTVTHQQKKQSDRCSKEQLTRLTKW